MHRLMFLSSFRSSAVRPDERFTSEEENQRDGLSFAAPFNLSPYHGGRESDESGAASSRYATHTTKGVYPM